ncbi:hypothetical protein DB30_00513 [Enhygromyxa salina]|uniref:Uncharacterized protein n=1 Tax=Enhygromyxa salina TaxID=215803 RepID=A0A0C2CU45_9BACT|nr:hypothetical protein DB30_00513 [Enhygromyxa salina]
MDQRAGAQRATTGHLHNRRPRARLRLGAVPHMGVWRRLVRGSDLRFTCVRRDGQQQEREERDRREFM